MEKEYLYRILHKPTGLFYGAKKGRWRETITNLSKNGKFYDTEKVAKKVLKADCGRAAINEAQTNRSNLPIDKHTFYFNIAKAEDFEILKYEVVLVK